MTLVAFFAVNTMGFIDTETGSAYGCGHQWPLCNGSIIPTIWGMQTIIEFAHRGLVAVATVLLLIWVVIAWAMYGRAKTIRFFIITSLFGVFLEAFLGAMGVIFSDPPAVLAVHFGVSVLAFVSVFLLYVNTTQLERARTSEGIPSTLRRHLPNPRFAAWVWSSLLAIYIAMYVGAYVTSTGDGTQFRGWPFPTETYAQAGNAFVVDIVHRSIALMLVLMSVYLFMMARRMRAQRPDLYRGSIWTLVLICAQAISGAILVLSGLRMWAFLIHVTVVTFLFGSVSYLALQVNIPKTKR